MFDGLFVVLEGVFFVSQGQGFLNRRRISSFCRQSLGFGCISHLDVCKLFTVRTKGQGGRVAVVKFELSLERWSVVGGGVLRGDFGCPQKFIYAFNLRPK
jgi:hypothetical protein